MGTKDDGVYAPAARGGQLASERYREASRAQAAAMTALASQLQAANTALCGLPGWPEGEEKLAKAIALVASVERALAAIAAALDTDAAP